MTAPGNALTIYEDGQSQVSGDELNSLIQGALTASILRGFVGASGMQVMLGGINYIGDGGGGVFYWSAASTAADNNSTVIVPTAASKGAWLRLGTSSVIGNLALRTTSIDTTLLSTDGILEVNASTGSRMITVPTSLGLSGVAGVQMRRIIKTDTSTNPVYLSTDGVTALDAITSPASSAGQIGGWRDVYIQEIAANTPLFRSMGVG